MTFSRFLPVDETCTQLHIAASNGTASDIERILKEQYWVYSSKPKKNDENPALFKKHLIDTQDSGGWTALMWAAEYGNKEALTSLLKHGASTELLDNENNTALHWVALSGDFSAAKVLIDACGQSLIDFQNEYGDTPLTIACLTRFYRMVEYLVSKGANLLLKNVTGSNSIDICTNLDDINLASCLKLPLLTLQHQQKVICSDVSNGKEKFVVPVFNSLDNCSIPNTFCYAGTTCPVGITLNFSDILENSCSCRGQCKPTSCPCLITTGSDLNGCLVSGYDPDGCLKSSQFFDANEVVIKECSPYCSCGPSCHNRVAQNGIQYRLHIRRTHLGWALFSSEDIPAYRFVAEYTGELLSESQIYNRDDDAYLFDIKTAFRDQRQNCVIDAKFYGNVTRFINHSCDPNVSCVKVFWDHVDQQCPHMCFFTKRPISAGQEIVINYGDGFWSVKGHTFECECRSPVCKYSGESLKKFLRLET